MLTARRPLCTGHQILSLLIMLLMLVPATANAHPCFPESDANGKPQFLSVDTFLACRNSKITQREYSAALLRIAAEVAKLHPTPGGAQLYQLADTLAAYPQLADVSVMDNGTAVVVQFQDGRAVTILLNRPRRRPHNLDETSAPPHQEAETIASRAAQRGVIGAPQPLDFTALPQGRRIRLYNGLGNLFQTPHQAIEDSFRVDPTYRVTTRRATVAQLRRLGAPTTASDAVFYIDSHGGAAMIPPPCIDGMPTQGPPSREFVLWTSSYIRVDPHNPLRARNDFPQEHACGEIATLLAPDSQVNAIPGDAWVPRDALGTPLSRNVWHYAITARFVRQFVQFGPGALVFINSCYSDAPHAANFKAACFERGAAVYAGWTDGAADPDANFVASYIFDRLLGSNRFRPETPPQRPFAWPAVVNDMAARGLDRSVTMQTLAPGMPPSPVTAFFTMEGRQANGEFGLFRPSIRRLASVDLVGPEMVISGIFGPDPGTVTLDGRPLAIQDWSRDAITCTLPPTGGGEVVVTVGGHASPPVPLTQWTLTFGLDGMIASREDTRGRPNYAYDLIERAFDRTGSGRVMLRADVHGYRDEPHGPLFGETLVSSLNGRVTAFTVNGTTTFVQRVAGRPDLVYTTVTNPAIIPPVPNAFAFGQLDAVAGTGDISLNLSVPHGDFVTTSVGGTFTVPFDLGISEVQLTLDPMTYDLTATGGLMQFTPATASAGGIASGGTTVTADPVRFRLHSGGPSADVTH